jgi:sigma-B regulation protein RsbU (phosphoserine phosphatase)
VLVVGAVEGSEAWSVPGPVEVVRLARAEPGRRGDVIVLGRAAGTGVARALRRWALAEDAPFVVCAGTDAVERERMRRLAEELGLLALDAGAGSGESAVRAALRLKAAESRLAESEAERRALARRLSVLEDRTAEELRLAVSVQRSLLPPLLPDPRLDLAAEFMPAREVGGDHYDLVPLDRGRIGFAIGDVMGKGMPAALLAVNLKAVVRAHLHTGEEDCGEVMSRVNRVLYDVMPRGRFATLFFGVFDFDRGLLQYVNAGHYPPLVLGADGETRELSVGGTILGALEDVRYECGRHELRPGDRLIFYTDGVIDRLDREGEFFGAERLKQAAWRSAPHAPRIALYSILGDLQAWSGGGELEDDLTLVVARVR